MPQKLWVEHQIDGKKYGPTRVPIEECDYVDDFLNRLYTRPLLAIPPNVPITLYKSDGTTPIKPTDTVESLREDGKDGNAPLVVKSTSLVVAVPTSILPYQTQLSSFPICQVPFYNNIYNATERDGWISFGQNIPSTTLKDLYIRESYRTIASSINPGINKAIITGTPGIGKSLFLIYLLWKLVKEGKRVLLIYHPFNIYYDGNGGVFHYASGQLPLDNDDAFWNKELWCLFDAKSKKESLRADIQTKRTQLALNLLS